MWNHRIIRTVKDGTTSLGLYEVMYNDDGSILAHSEDAIDLSGYESAEDLKESLFLMVSDVEQHVSGEKEILDADKIKFVNNFDDDEFIEMDINDLLED
tara:strand:+ start:674 stop:970 length:297 start_codon:yes stop_codon:yes gene_type:complete